MKCFYHPAQDAVGICPQCSKAACSDCLKQLGGGILCKGCIAQRLRAINAENKAALQQRESAIHRAHRRLRYSKVVFRIAFIFGALVALAMVYQGLVSKDPMAPGLFTLIVGGILGSFLVGYYAWSFFWGVPAIWNGVRGMFRKVGFFIVMNPVNWLILLLVVFAVLAFAGELYCILGGGWSQYRKNLRIARGEV
jgi:hypothetical protein